MPSRSRQNRQADEEVEAYWLRSQKLHGLCMECRDLCGPEKDTRRICGRCQKRLELIGRRETDAGEQRRGEQQWTRHRDTHPTSQHHQLASAVHRRQSCCLKRLTDLVEMLGCTYFLRSKLEACMLGICKLEDFTALYLKVKLVVLPWHSATKAGVRLAGGKCASSGVENGHDRRACPGG